MQVTGSPNIKQILRHLLQEQPVTLNGIENQLAELEMLKVALDISSIVVFTDESGIITHVNENFCRISGYSKEELIGKTHQIVNSGYHSKEFFQDMWKTISQGKVWRGEICNRKKNSSIYWLDTTIVPFPYAGPYGSRYVAIRNDITEKKKIQEELQEDNLRSLESAKMASMGELSAGIAHELGNPIGAIQGRAEMLFNKASQESGDLAQYSHKTAEIILSLTQRMTSIIRAMKAFARDGTNDPFTWVSLKNIIDSTVEFGLDRYRRKNIKVISDVGGEDLFFKCRETQIIQILVNLINNSCDAVQDLPEKWVRISSKVEPDYISIFVTDSGTGIPQHIQETIFTKFFTTKSAGQGTGLGLYIARKIARDHQGDLKIVPDCHNTRFELKLPLRQAADRPGTDKP